MSQKLRMETTAPQKDILMPARKAESIKKPNVLDVSSAVVKDNDIETKLDLLYQIFLEISQQDKQLFKDNIEEFKKL